MALLALMLISAIAIGMMFVSSTETTIASNFRSEETAYFAARAGVEEVRDRMLPSPPNPSSGNYSINSLVSSSQLFMPGSGSNPWALYILNGKNLSGANMQLSDVTSGVNSGNKLADDEFCHDFYNAPTGMTYQAGNVKCIDLPSSSHLTSTTSITPLNGGTNPVDYKWVRVTLKANNSYSGSNSAGWVDNSTYGSSPAVGTYQVCWSGSNAGAHEIVIPPGHNCEEAAYNAMPVFLLTALAVTPSGARRIVQQEVAQTFIPYNPPGGLFAVGSGCGALIVGGNATTGSFNSATENPPTNPPSNSSLTGGNVGTNGNSSIMGNSTHINGSVSSATSTTVGVCPGSGVTVSGTPTWGTPAGSVTGGATYNPPVPPMPNPLPPTTSVSWSSGSKTAGSYGNVSISGNVTLTGGTANNPAIFNINSLSIGSNATLTVSGYAVINLAGQQLAAGSYVLNMTGNANINNASAVPAAFTVNYGGSNPIKITGNTNTYAFINAPNSAVSLHGSGPNAAFYGAVIGNTIDDSGGVNFYWDAGLTVPPPANTTTFHDVALRELSY